MRILKPLGILAGIVFILLSNHKIRAATNVFNQDTTLASLYFKKAEVLEDSAKYDTAIVYFTKASEIYAEKKCWNEYINSLLGVTRQHRNKANYKTAQTNIKKILRLAHEKLDSNNLVLGNCYNLQGSLYHDLKNLDSALYYFEKAFRIRYDKLGEKSIDVAMSYKNIGIVYSDLGKYDLAYDYYNKALKICIEINGINDELTAQVYNTLGVLMYEKGDYPKSEEYLTKVLEIRQNILGKDHPDIASAYNNLGVIAKTYSNYAKALEYYEKALKIRLKNYGQTHQDVALSYSNMGVVYSKISEPEKAMEYYFTALKIRQNIFGENHPDVAWSYNNIAIEYMEQGNYNMAIEYFNKSLNILLKVYEPDNPVVANLYNNIGSIKAYIGHYDEAIKYFKKALEIRLKSLGPHHDLLSGGYHNIGEIYLRKGDYNYAMEYYKKSMQIDITNFGKGNPHLASNYNSIGAVYEKIGEYDNAIQYYKKAIAILEKQDTSQRESIASYLGNIAIAYDLKNDTAKAEEFYYKSLNKKLEIYNEKNENVIIQYSNLSKFYLSNNNIDKAYDFAIKSLNLKLELYKKHPLIASDYMVLACIHKERNNLAKSILYINKALCQISDECDTLNYYWLPVNFNITDYPEFIEIMDTKAKILKAFYEKEKNIDYLIATEAVYQKVFEVNSGLRSGYYSEASKFILTSKIARLYKNALSVEFQLYKLTNRQQYLLKAFSISEYKKAGILKESISNSNAKKFSGIPDSLIHKEELIHSELAQYQTITEGWQPQNKKDSIELAGINSRIIELRLKYEKLNAKFEQEYPEYNRLKKVTIFNSFDKIKESLNQGDIMLEYAITDSILFIFTITNQSVKLTHVPIDSSLIENINEFGRSLRKNRINKYLITAQHLYKNLIAPVESKIRNKQKLIIIPDGIIGTIPFEALFINDTKIQNESLNNLNFLIKNYDIVYNYSADLWLNSIKKTTLKQGKTLSMVGFAPVFKQENNKGVILSNEGSIADSLMLNLATRSGILNNGSVRELSHSEEELKAITNLFKQSGYKYKAYLNKEANKDNFINNIKNYDIIHIATHGISNDQNPELSGLLFYGNSSREDTTLDHETKTKGFLYSSEMYNLDLNAALVVLSACETGTGKIVNGEGVISMTRGLMYSGAKNLMVSLWKVGDESTKGLMVNFYEYYITHNSISEALRQAKLELIKNEETAFPKFWSGFILIGSD